MANQMMKTCNHRWDKGAPCKFNGGKKCRCWKVVKVQDPDGTVRKPKHNIHVCFCTATKPK